MNMFDDFDSQNNQKQEEDEDSETSCYSYPSYSRFTYTGKTKSRLGRNRFLKQTGTKDETQKAEDSSKSSDVKSNSCFLQTNSQAPKTPGVSWLQRDASLSSHPFTPGAKSNNVHGSYSDINSSSSQSNFLFNLKNDSDQSSNCKRNLPFSTTPFKSKAETSGNQVNDNPLRDLNQLSKPENPFSKLDFFNRSKEENKENNGNTNRDDVKNKELNPTWNRLKRICDSAIPCPDSSKVSTGNPINLIKTNENLKSGLLPPSDIVERKGDDSSSLPLDLSSAESTANRTIFSRNSTIGSDGDSSGFLNRLLKDTSKESVSKADDSTTQKTNTDALSGFLPQFLVPKNKNPKTGCGEDDDSAHSVGTVVEKMFDLQSQAPFQKTKIPSLAFNKTPSGNHSVEVNRKSEVYSSSNCESTWTNDVKKLSPPSLPINFTFKDTSTSIQTNNKVQESSYPPKLDMNSEPKLLPLSVSGNVMSSEPPTLPPSSAPSITDVRNLVTNGQYLLNNDQSYLVSPNDRGMDSLAQSLEKKLGIVTKPSNEKLVNPIISDKNVSQVKNPDVFSSSNEICGFQQHKLDTKAADSNNLLVNNHQKLPLTDKSQRNGEPANSLYQLGDRPEPRLLAPIAAVAKNINQSSFHSKPGMIDQREPALYGRSTDNVQPSHHSQKTYLAPQQPLNNNNVVNFPHVKPEVPQLAGAKPSFPPVKKPSQYKMSVARGMPSRADTELSVNGKSYTILSMLGKGGSSEVYQVLDPCSSKLLAVKCVDLSMVDKTIADGYLNEIDLLSRLQGCASVIRMFDYEYMQECKMLYVVMEKGDTDLSHLIRDISKTKKISMSMIIYYWTEMLQAVKDIHDQGIIHSDLKPANFLLVSGRLKLIDFGIASSQGDMTSVVKEVTTGTWNYMSPEAIKNTNASGKGFKITYKSDVWSLGCILYNLVYGKTPFSHITNTWGKLTAIADPNHCIEFPDVGAPAVLVKALQSCFHREPKLRPTVAELLGLPYHSIGDVTSLGQQVHAILPTQWWIRVAHLFPGVKPNQEGKHFDNTG